MVQLTYSLFACCLFVWGACFVIGPVGVLSSQPQRVADTTHVLILAIFQCVATCDPTARRPTTTSTMGWPRPLLQSLCLVSRSKVSHVVWEWVLDVRVCDRSVVGYPAVAQSKLALTPYT